MKSNESHKERPTTSTVKAFVASLLLSLSPACDNIEANQSDADIPAEPPKPKGNQPEVGNEADETGKDPVENIDVSECGGNVKFFGRGRAGQIWATTSPETTEEQKGCVFDKWEGRDCGPIRRAGIRRIERIPNMFKCDEEGNMSLAVPAKEFLTLDNFEGEEGVSDGDCRGVLTDFHRRIRTLLDRMHCNDDNEAEEDLGGFGRANGGRFYNPCSGGKC